MKKIKYFILLTLVFIMSGCLNYSELNDMGIINTIGINKDGNNYIININMLDPTIEELDKSKSYKVEANSITQAFDKLYLLTTKSVNLSHLELLLLNNNLKKEDYDNIADFFLNRNDSRKTFNIVILDNYQDDLLFKYESKDINDLIETNHQEDGIIAPKSFDEVVADIMNNQISYIPTIRIDDKIEILGYSSVYKENKLLTIKESISYNFLTNKIVKANLIDENINIKVDKNITTVSTKNNEITINIISTLTSYDDSSNIVLKYNKIIKDYLNDFLENNDLEHFKQLIKKYNFKYYKQHPNMKMKFKIKVESKLNQEVRQNER